MLLANANDMKKEELNQPLGKTKKSGSKFAKSLKKMTSNNSFSKNKQ